MVIKVNGKSFGEVVLGRSSPSSKSTTNSTNGAILLPPPETPSETSPVEIRVRRKRKLTGIRAEGFSSLKKRVGDLEASLSEKEKEIVVLKGEVETKTKENGESKTRILEIEKTLEELPASMQGFEMEKDQRISALASEKKELEGKITQATSELEAIRREISILESKKDEEVRRLESELSIAETKVGKIEEKWVGRVRRYLNLLAEQKARREKEEKVRQKAEEVRINKLFDRTSVNLGRGEIFKVEERAQELNRRGQEATRAERERVVVERELGDLLKTDIDTANSYFQNGNVEGIKKMKDFFEKETFANTLRNKIDELDPKNIIPGKEVFVNEQAAKYKKEILEVVNDLIKIDEEVNGAERNGHSNYGKLEDVSDSQASWNSEMRKVLAENPDVNGVSGKTYTLDPVTGQFVDEAGNPIQDESYKGSDDWQQPDVPEVRGRVKAGRREVRRVQAKSVDLPGQEPSELEKAKEKDRLARERLGLEQIKIDEEILSDFNEQLKKDLTSRDAEIVDEGREKSALTQEELRERHESEKVLGKSVGNEGYGETLYNDEFHFPSVRYEHVTSVVEKKNNVVDMAKRRKDRVLNQEIIDLLRSVR